MHPVRRNAAAGIYDTDYGIFSGGKCRAIPQQIFGKGAIFGFDMNGAARGHRVAGVDDKVDDNLFQLALVGAYLPQIDRMRHLQLYLFAQQTVQQMGQIRQHILQINLFRFQGLLAR